jgi:hypothetical protein
MYFLKNIAAYLKFYNISTLMNRYFIIADQNSQQKPFRELSHNICFYEGELWYQFFSSLVFMVEIALDVNVKVRNCYSL